jgi:beta-glucuronidase
MGRSLVRKIDRGMLPITWAGWHPHKGEPHFEHADIVGFNEYRGSLDAFEDLAPDMEIVTKQNPGKPIVIMENGSWATLGRRGSPKKSGTEDWQARLITRQWEVLRQHKPQLSGYVHWLLKDYRTRRAYTARKSKNGWNRMGLYSEKGEPKLARDVFRDLEMSGK